MNQLSCQACGHSTVSDVESSPCPHCGVNMVVVARGVELPFFGGGEDIFDPDFPDETGGFDNGREDSYLDAAYEGRTEM